MNVSALVRKMGPLIGLIVLFVVISALNSSFIDPSNLKNLLRQVSINALISFGMTFVILTGGIDLSVGSTLALSSAIMASLIKGGMDPIMGIVVAAIIGLILGTINGVVISYGHSGNHDYYPRPDFGLHRRQPYQQLNRQPAVPYVRPGLFCRHSCTGSSYAFNVCPLLVYS